MRRFFESLDGQLEDDLCVRICKETIRGNLAELMRSASGGAGVGRLEDMEAGRVQAGAVNTVSSTRSPTIWDIPTQKPNQNNYSGKEIFSRQPQDRWQNAFRSVLAILK